MNGMSRVNASMLPENVGKLVCLVGKIVQVSNSVSPHEYFDIKYTDIYLINL